MGKLFGLTVPPNKTWRGGTVPSNKTKRGGLPSNTM